MRKKGFIYPEIFLRFLGCTVVKHQILRVRSILLSSSVKDDTFRSISDFFCSEMTPGLLLEHFMKHRRGMSSVR